MNDRIDHAAEARRAMRQTLDACETDENTGALISIAAAQVHATLALVEQQRIANLVALSRPQDFRPDGANIRIPSFDEEGMLRPDIAAALGFEVGADS